MGISLKNEHINILYGKSMNFHGLAMILMVFVSLYQSYYFLKKNVNPEQDRHILSVLCATMSLKFQKVIEMDKASRILVIFCRLLRRERLHKTELMEEYHITSRSVERDFQIIRLILAELHETMELVYHRTDDSYSLSAFYAIELSSMNVIVILNMLFGCKALRKDELSGLISSLYELLSSQEQKELYRFIENGLNHYREPLHGKSIIKMQWDLQSCISKHQKIRILYVSNEGISSTYDILPSRITFSESYFYLAAYHLDNSYCPAFYRVDHIVSFTILGKAYGENIPQDSMLSHISPPKQPVYTGQPVEVKIKCSKQAIESVLDQIPDHQIINKQDGVILVVIRVFADDFLHWVMTQGKHVEILEPVELRHQMESELRELLAIYRRPEKSDTKEDTL